MFKDMEMRGPHGWIKQMSVQRARVWLDHLQAERKANGAHPQLERDIADLEDHISHLEQLIRQRQAREALAAWDAAKKRDDELCMYVAGQKMAAALRQRI